MLGNAAVEFSGDHRSHAIKMAAKEMAARYELQGKSSRRAIAPLGQGGARMQAVFKAADDRDRTGDAALGRRPIALRRGDVGAQHCHIVALLTSDTAIELCEER